MIFELGTFFELNHVKNLCLLSFDVDQHFIGPKMYLEFIFLLSSSLKTGFGDLCTMRNLHCPFMTLGVSFAS